MHWGRVDMSSTEVTVLVVEDEEKYRRLLVTNLKLEGYAVTPAATGQEALQVLYEREPDLILLDLRLPEVDGFELCRRFRQITSTPILVLTALNTEADLIHALDLGADDYMTKPFSLQELLARIRALIRRSQSMVGEEDFKCGQVRLIPGLREVEVVDHRHRLTPTEWQLMRELIVHCGKVLTHEHLLTKVWGAEYRNEHEYLRVYVRRLRSYIEPDQKRPVYLVIHTGVGYILYPTPHEAKP